MKKKTLVAVLAPVAVTAIALAAALGETSPAPAMTADPTTTHSSLPPAQAPTVRLVGWVSDGHCTTKHMKEGGETCVRKCIAGATHLNPEWTAAGMVFVTEDKKVWKVDNADALWGYESKRIEIEGTLNPDKGSVRVSKFIAPKPSS